MNRRFDVVFHPRWWNCNAGIDFGEAFWYDAKTRMAADVRMRAALYEHFGRFGLGEQEPAPRPLVGSDLLACGWLGQAILGCEIRFSQADPPQVICAELDEDAAMALRKPDLDADPVWLAVQGQLDELSARFGRVETHLNLVGVLNVAMDLRGQEIFLDFLDEDSPVAAHLLQVSCETLLEIGRRLRRYSPHLSAGVTSIMGLVAPEVYLTSNCTVEMVSQELYERHLLPYDKRLAEAFAPFGVHHCGQTMEHVIGGYNKLPNLRFVEVGAGSDLRAVAEALPPDSLINARYSPVALQSDSAAAIDARVAEIAKIVPGKRLSVSCVGIDDGVPDAKITAFLEACRRYLAD